jgi:hypothetical protein
LYKKLLYLFLFFSASCHALAADIKDSRRERISTKNRIACPSGTFSHFLKEFSENLAVQRKFIRYPLEQQRLDLDAEPEPKPIIRMLKPNQITFPVIPNKGDRDKQLLQLNIYKKSTNLVKLTITQPDTDYQVSYFFLQKSCWYLVRIEDWSL